jgi:hypothetical protein
MANELVEISALLTTAEQLPWTDALYLPSQEAWTIQTKGAVLNPDECEHDQDVPDFAAAQGLQYTLGLHQIQEVVQNARQQKPDVTVDDLFRAFLHYYDHDAFIRFATN